MHNHELGMDLLKVSLVWVLPGHRSLIFPQVVLEEDGFPQVADGDVMIGDQGSSNRTPSPNNAGLAGLPGRSPLGLCRPVSA